MCNEMSESRGKRYVCEKKSNGSIYPVACNNSGRDRDSFLPGVAFAGSCEEVRCDG